MISSFLKQRFGEPVHVSHPSAAELKFLQTMVDSCLTDTCISTCLTPDFLAPFCIAS
jgi:hypothetical protein